MIHVSHLLLYLASVWCGLLFPSSFLGERDSSNYILQTRCGFHSTNELAWTIRGQPVDGYVYNLNRISEWNEEELSWTRLLHLQSTRHTYPAHQQISQSGKTCPEGVLSHRAS